MRKDVTVKGWPRKRLPYTRPSRSPVPPSPETKQLPNLYIGGRNQETNDWTTFEAGRSEECYKERLCAVCGEKLNRVTMYGRSTTTTDNGYMTNGPGCHPRCFAMALKFCPHFQFYPPEDTVAYVYTRPRHAYYKSWVTGWSGEVYGENFRVFRTCLKFTRADCINEAKTNPLGT